MPKKTKRQKLLAQLHRKIDLVKREIQEDSRKNPPSVASNFIYNKQVAPKPQILSRSMDYSYLRSDLIKITIFTFSALIFQGVLYFFLRTR